MKNRLQRQFEPTDKELLAHRKDNETVPNFDQKYFVRASTLGSFPGKDFLDAMYRIRGELGAPHLPVLPELPERGYQATKLARTICCLEGLSADGTASGWRIRTGRAEETERAYSLFNSDINALADVIGQEKTQTPTPYKIQLLGPISLLASVYRSNGELLISDYGARRDIVQSFVEGIRSWLVALDEASRFAPIVLELDEPLLKKAMDGAIPTSSGYKTHRNVPLHEVQAAYSLVAEELKPSLAELALKVPSSLTPEIYSEADAVVFSLEKSDSKTWENMARLVESGRNLYLGVQHPQHYAAVSERAQWFLKNWRTVGLPVESLTQVTVTESQELTGIQPDIATTVLHHLAELSRAVSELASDID